MRLHEFAIGSALGDFPISDSIDVVGLRQEMQSMRNEDTGLAGWGIEEYVLEDGGADMGIQCGERIVEDQDVAIGVNGTTDIYSLFLTSRE